MQSFIFKSLFIISQWYYSYSYIFKHNKIILKGSNKRTGKSRRNRFCFD